MLKILKRLTAIVLSVMMLLTGKRGYAMDGNNNITNNTASQISLILSDSNYASVHDDGLPPGEVILNYGENQAGGRLLKDMQVLIFNDAQIDHLHSSFKIDKDFLNNVIHNNHLNDIDFEKGIIAISAQDFFLYPPENMQDLVNKCELKKDLTDFYSLSDMSQIDIENGQKRGENGTYKHTSKQACRTICCGLKKRWIVPAVVLISAGAFIVSMIGLAQDGWTKNEKIAAVFLGVLFLASAVAGGVATRECAKGCCDCCAPGGKAFLDRRYSEPTCKDVNYFMTFLNDIEINNNLFSNLNTWEPRDTILFFPLKSNNKYIIGVLKNIHSLGPRMLPNNYPEPSSFETIFSNNRSYFLAAIENGFKRLNVRRTNNENN